MFMLVPGMIVIVALHIIIGMAVAVPMVAAAQEQHARDIDDQA